MRDLSGPLLQLLLLVGLLIVSRRMLVASVGQQSVRRLERLVILLYRAWLWVVLAPFRLALAVVRLRFQRGRPLLRSHDARLVDVGPAIRHRQSDRDVFRPRRRRGR